MSEPNLHDFLIAQPAVAVLVGTNVFPDKVRQGVKMPAIVWQKTASLRQQKPCGTDGLVLGSFQVDIYATTRAVARELATEVLEAMLDFAGLMGDCIVKHCALTTDFDSVDPEPGLLRRTQLWDIWYVER
jgi:hypothetical protein